MERPLLASWETVAYYAAGAPGTHLVSLIAVASLATWSFRRYRGLGLLVPALVVVYSELQFNLIAVGVYHAPIITDLLALAAAPAVIIGYAFFFRRVPRLMLLTGYAVLLLDVADGFRLSYGFGTPYWHDLYTNGKEMISWCVVCLAAWYDNRRKAWLP